MGCVKAAGVGGLIDVALLTLAESGTTAGVGWWVGAIRTPLTSLPPPLPSCHTILIDRAPCHCIRTETRPAQRRRSGLPGVITLPPSRYPYRASL